MTPFNKALASFDAAMRIADRHRHELKTRFGFTDQQIGLAVLARRKTNQYRELAKAVVAAKQRQANGRAK
jgi:hypothetical protein